MMATAGIEKSAHPIFPRKKSPIDTTGASGTPGADGAQVGTLVLRVPAGAAVGTAVGAAVGAAVGTAVGAAVVGAAVGAAVGCAAGAAVLPSALSATRGRAPPGAAAFIGAHSAVSAAAEGENASSAQGFRTTARPKSRPPAGSPPLAFAMTSSGRE